MTEKRAIAAMSAVMQYMRTEEEAAMAAAGPAVRPAPRLATTANVWGISGRDSMMQLRNLMQLKAMHGARWR